MPLPRRASIFLLAGFHALLFCVAARDLVVFDEDDPLGIEYYDASIGRAAGGSTLRLSATSRDKMPVTAGSAATGKVSGVLEWNSQPGGVWEMHVFRPGFPILNLAEYESITLAVSGPEAIPAHSLPVIEFQDVRGVKLSLALDTILPGGVDSDARTWQRISIALRQFPKSENFNRKRVKHVTFRQSAPDKTQRTLWIDDVRLRNAGSTQHPGPPEAPRNLVGRFGDRTITLHWELASEEVSSYRVYRATEANGPFEETDSSPVQIASIADTKVENAKTYFYRVHAENEAAIGSPSEILRIEPKPFDSDEAFLEYLQATAFDYFWYEANPKNGLIRDRSQPWSAASIAAIGFGLTAIGIGIDHGWITREQGLERALRTLTTLWETPQSSAEDGTSGYRGWFYHFLDMENGTRFGTSELSSIDTALLLAGVLYVAEYFSASHPKENQIRQLAERILSRVDWKWMLNDGKALAMGWYPDRGFTTARWNRYNEGSILYIIGMGAPGENRLGAEHWNQWTEGYQWQTSFGYSYVHFAPLFGHQYSACWIDFRQTADRYMRSKKMTYFENSRRATLAQREYCIANPEKFPGYSEDVWGLTACDGPGGKGSHSYIARGAPPAENDDGTIAPTAVGGSLPFAPTECIRALRTMYDRYREKIWCGYGFRDAFNLKEDWWGADVIGIDQGPILIMAENLRTGRVWRQMGKSKTLQKGLEEGGFQPVVAETQIRK